MTLREKRKRARSIMAEIRRRRPVRHLIGRWQLSTRQLQRYAARAGVKLNHGPKRK